MAAIGKPVRHTAIPAGRSHPGYDAVLAVEEALGVILATRRACELAGPAGVRLHELAGLGMASFPRSQAPAWYDQVTAILRSHGIIQHDGMQASEHSLIAEVKIAAVATGRAFALAPPGWADPQPSGPLPSGVTWRH